MSDAATGDGYLRRLKWLCLGRSEKIVPWLEERSAGWMVFCCAVIVVCGGCYGFSVGLWRAPLQGVFVAVKVPLLLFLVSAGNGVLNGMLGQVLGTGLSFRKTALLVLFSFTIASVILGAFSPISFFVTWCLPAIDSGGHFAAHSLNLLLHVALIADAGVMANYRLLQLLERVCPQRKTALAALLAWLAGNLFLGAQLSWILRPFIGSPNLTVQFLRADALNGNFYEAVWRAFKYIFF